MGSGFMLLLALLWTLAGMLKLGEGDFSLAGIWFAVACLGFAVGKLMEREEERRIIK